MAPKGSIKHHLNQCLNSKILLIYTCFPPLGYKAKHFEITEIKFALCLEIKCNDLRQFWGSI